LDFNYSPFTGQLDTLIAPSDTTTYSYNGSLVTSVSKGGTNLQHLNYFYDNNFRVTDQELWVPNPNSDDFDRTTEYNYDQDGLVTSISTYDNSWNMVAPPMSITYDPTNGLPVSTSLGNMYTGQTYNERGKLDSFEADYNSSAIFQTTYGRDSLGRITQINEMVDGRGEKKNYTYDIAGRLWKVWRNDTIISSYSYDPNGNRIAHVTPTSADSGTYDAQDRLLKYSSTQYSYTSNGELQKKIVGTDTTRYSYDYFGNFTKVIMPNGDQIDYIIDGQNRRIGKKINGVIVNRWIYSGQLSPIAELDSAGNVTAQFVSGYMIKNGNTYQLIRDHLGSVRVVIDVNSGAVTQQIDYDEFGNTLSNTNPDFQPFAYAGGLYDIQTKLTRFGARDFEAISGRWTKKDPIGFGGGVSNLYEYCINDPITYVDLKGQQTLSIGVSVNLQWGPFSFSGSAGFAIDAAGNLGTYSTVGVGGGAGAKVSGGVTATASNAKTICDLAGPFYNATAGGGAGGDIEGTAFSGSSPHGWVTGGGATVGAGLGAGGSVTYTGTIIKLLVKLW
jgi:RHS repeat-associated protein